MLDAHHSYIRSYLLLDALLDDVDALQARSLKRLRNKDGTNL